MTPQPAPAYLARVKAAVDDAERKDLDVLLYVMRALGVSCSAAIWLVRLVKGEDVPPPPPRTVDR